jgi:hypothetical protein
VTEFTWRENKIEILIEIVEILEVLFDIVIAYLYGQRNTASRNLPTSSLKQEI